MSVKEGETESLLVCVSRVKSGKRNNSIVSGGVTEPEKKGVYRPQNRIILE